MNEFLFHNKISFYEKEETHISFGFWISLILSIFFFCGCTIDIRLSTPYFATYEEATNTLIILCPIKEIEKLSKQELIKIDQKIYNFQIISKEELLIDETNQQNVQKIIVKSPQKLKNNQILQIYLLDAKEKIITKIQKMIQGG